MEAQSGLLGNSLETHRLAAKSMRGFLVIFLIMDLMVLCEYAQVVWTPDPLATQLQVAEVGVTLTFICDVCLALVALWLTRRPPRGNAWWASQYTVIKANYISNVISMVVLAYCRLIQANGDATLLLVAALYIFARAAKLRPLARWYARVASAHDHPDEPISFEGLQSVWDPQTEAMAQKCLLRVTGLMMASIVAGLGFAAWWDASYPPKIANNSTIISTMGGPTTNLRGVAGEHPEPLELDITIVPCDDGMLSAAANGCAAGAAAAAGLVFSWFWCCTALPIGEIVALPAVAAAGTVGGFFGLFGGIFSYIAACS